MRCDPAAPHPEPHPVFLSTAVVELVGVVESVGSRAGLSSNTGPISDAWLSMESTSSTRVSSKRAPDPTSCNHPFTRRGR